MQMRLLQTLSISLVAFILVTSGGKAVEQSSNQPTSNVTPKPSQRCTEMLKTPLKNLSKEELSNKQKVSKVVEQYLKTPEGKNFETMCRPKNTVGGTNADSKGLPWYWYILCTLGAPVAGLVCAS
jgi:ABC-type dipeptide/oligopeptide/nickel transport system ATPase component